MESFAVLWSESDHPPRAGKLELGAAGLRFDGRQAQSVRYADIESVHVGRDTRARIAGRPALVLALAAGGPVRIASVGGVGVLSELAERLANLIATRATL
ncbi:MAG: hypothetical protein ACJ768_07920 [Gaiellaceae bacterium]